MLLYFLRHGDAVQLPSLSDSERPLSDHGEHQAKTVGAFLRSSDIRIERIITSPLIRAVRTAEIVAEAIQAHKPQKTEHLVPGSDKRQLFGLINAAGSGSILLTGHVPHLSQTVSLLLSEHEDLPIEFRKCSLACVDATVPVRRGCGMLQWLLTYQQMESKHV
jgi:phosphohistidine phosphatase